jgi:4-hydroxy-tetrahydrodipicolinate synthase
MSKFQNVMTALVTPFHRGEVDEESFVKLIHQQLDNGIEGFVVGGTTGESPTLTEHELERLFQITKSEAGSRVPVVVGTGSNSTATTIEKTKRAKAWGAAAALVVVPYYNRPPQRGLISHFSLVTKAVDLPIILYNVPTRTSCSLDPESSIELSKEKGIVGIKEATGNLEYLTALKEIERKPFWLLSGDDGSGVEFCLRGGHGIISVVSHVIPKELSDLVKAAREGDASSLKTYENYKNLLHWLYIEANPIPVKWALAEMGVIRSSELRLPLVALSNSHFEGFKACLKKLGKI